MDSNVQRFVDKYYLKGKENWDFGAGQKSLDKEDVHALVEALKSVSSPPVTNLQFCFFFHFFFFPLPPSPAFSFLFCFFKRMKKTERKKENMKEKKKKKKNKKKKNCSPHPLSFFSLDVSKNLFS